MLDIREYFQLVDDDELEYAMYDLSQDDYDAFEQWALEQGIDLMAQQEVLGSMEYVVTLWSWDMCGD